MRRNKARLAGGVLFVAALACVLYEGATHALAESHNNYNATAAILSTFRLRAEVVKGDSLITAHGTAFGVDLTEWGYPRPRYILTAWHVVRNDEGPGIPLLKIEVRTETNIYWTRCKLLAFDARRDLCLLESSTDLPFCTEFADEQPEAGCPVLHVGCPTGVRPTPFTGSVSDRDGYDLASANVKFFKQGCSGGPVFDGCSYKIIGVAVAGVKKENGASDEMDPNTALFVPLTGVKRFIQKTLPRRQVEPPAVAYRQPTPAPVPAPVYTPPPAPVPAPVAQPRQVPVQPYQPEIVEPRIAVAKPPVYEAPPEPQPAPQAPARPAHRMRVARAEINSGAFFP